MRFIPLLLVFSLFAQDDVGAPPKSGTTGSIGTVTLNGQVYNQLSIRPEIPIGKLGVGLDIYLYFNDEGMYWDSWDFSSGGSAYKTIIDKIYYLRWGQPGDNLYFMAGALPSVTLGQGILVNNYANIMEYPQVRQVGLNLQWGALPRLMTLVGPARAKEICLLGEKMSSDQALDWGLVSRLAEPGQSVDVALGLAQRCATNPPIASAMVKEAVNAIAGALHKVGSYADADQSRLSGTNQTAAAARRRFADKK